jgi:hypothetical protein
MIIFHMLHIREHRRKTKVVRKWRSTTNWGKHQTTNPVSAAQRSQWHWLSSSATVLACRTLIRYAEASQNSPRSACANGRRGYKKKSPREASLTVTYFWLGIVTPYSYQRVQNIAPNAVSDFRKRTWVGRKKKTSPEPFHRHLFAGKHKIRALSVHPSPSWHKLGK